MQDYKPNSHRYKEEQGKKAVEKKKIDKVVTGKVKTKKKGEISKLKDSIISEDFHNVGSYILEDLIIPTVKKTIVDAIKNSAEMIFLGKISSDSSRRRANSSYVSYRDYSRSDDRRSDDRYKRTGYDIGDIVLESRVEAEEVLQRMDELLDMYGIVSVADLYDLIGVSGEYTDNKYGWTNIRNAEAVRRSDGYALRLPKPLPID